MKYKNQIFVGIISLFLVTILLLGMAYAFYAVKINENESEKSVSVSSTVLELSYSDDKTIVKGENIEPGFYMFKTFTINYSGDEIYNYSINLEKINNTFVRNQDLKYYIFDGEYTTEESIQGVDAITQGNIVVGEHQILLDNVSIGKHGVNGKYSQTYTFYLKYENLTDVNQSVDMGKKLDFKINIAERKNNIENPISGSLLASIKNDVTNSSIMGSAEDDYGTSYYYKGNVENNYVNYSGKCFRIVRVQGDGTIKLVLADDEHECNNGYSITADTSAFIKVNVKDQDNGYNNPYAARWGANMGSVVSYENSEFITYINSWTNKLINKDLLALTDWCNDMSHGYMYYVYDDSGMATYHYEWDSSFENKEYAKVALYGAAQRSRANTPSLKCNFVGEDNSKSLKVNASVAALTQDEVLLALNGNESYLKTNAGTVSSCGIFGTCRGPLTLSPNHDSDGVYDSFPYQFGAEDAMSYNSLVRPSIVVKSSVILDTAITGQNGSYTNPYVIK